MAGKHMDYGDVRGPTRMVSSMPASWTEVWSVISNHEALFVAPLPVVKPAET